MPSRVITILFFILVSLLSCKKEENKNVRYSVTYKVKGLSTPPCNVMIYYKDSTQWTTLYTTKQQWSKTVSLPQNEPATLIVLPILDSDVYPDGAENPNSYIYDDGECRLIYNDRGGGYHPDNYPDNVSLEIIYKKKSVTIGSSKMVTLTLSPSGLS